MNQFLIINIHTCIFLWILFLQKTLTDAFPDLSFPRRLQAPGLPRVLLEHWELLAQHITRLLIAQEALRPVLTLG